MSESASAPVADCTFNVTGLSISESCPKCKHTGMAHPHRGNEIDHCLVCEMIAVIEEFKQAARAVWPFGVADD